MDSPPGRNCKRCNEPVAEAAYDYEVMEGMHYVCFHYEFEHSGDVDVPCGVAGCPSAGLRLKDTAAVTISPESPVGKLQGLTTAALGGFGAHHEHDDMVAADFDVSLTRFGPPPFRFVKTERKEAIGLVLTAEWLGRDEMPGAVVHDFVSLLDFLCQDSFFVEHRWVGSTICFDVVTGTRGEGLPPHGHVFRVEIVGDAIERIAKKRP